MLFLFSGTISAIKEIKMLGFKIFSLSGYDFQSSGSSTFESDVFEARTNGLSTI
jgi:broad specificity polyphosphatase/5'/3'-nucleotidase SurE